MTPLSISAVQHAMGRHLLQPHVRTRQRCKRKQQADGVRGAYVFINERGQPFGRMGIGRGNGSLAASPARSIMRGEHHRDMAALGPVVWMGVWKT